MNAKPLKSILLLTCKSPYLDDPRVHAPMGVLYLDAAVKRDLPHVKVEIDDDYDLTDAGLRRFEGFDAIGVSIMTPQRKEATAILNSVKSVWPKKVMIAGGPHVTYYTDDVAKETWDYMVKGDGERDIVKILKGEAKDRILDDILMRKELELIPKPDRIGRKDFLARHRYELRPGLKSTILIVGRGCPLACNFCASARSTTRWHSVDLAARELADIKTLGYEAFYIPDDMFAINLAMIKPYLDVIKESGLLFRCNAHAKFMNDKLAAALKDAGCCEMAFGAESGSQKILDAINKKTSVQQNYDFIRIAKNYGIGVKAYMMLGLPGEDHKTISETEEFIRKSIDIFGLDDFQLAIYYPYKGTAIRKAMDQNKDIDLQFLGEGLGAHTHGQGLAEARVRTKALSAEDLLRERTMLIKKYQPKSHMPAWKK
ncbi:MAG: radical SAM protein [Candidatus Omnitrophota bacterium]